MIGNDPISFKCRLLAMCWARAEQWMPMMPRPRLPPPRFLPLEDDEPEHLPAREPQ